MRGLKGVVAAVSLIASACLSAAAAEPNELLDNRFSDPETFGRYTDASRAHPDTVTSPQWGIERVRTPQANPVGLKPASRPRFSNQLIVPLAALRAEPVLEPVKPKGDKLGLLTLAAAAVGLGLVFLGTRQAKSERRRRVPKSTRTATPEELAPIREWESSDEPAPAIVAWNPPAPVIEPVFDSDPFFAESWRAISAREQHAIDLWDRSLDKQLGLASLNQWLDHHASELPGVDISSLKDKLRRDA